MDWFWELLPHPRIRSRELIALRAPRGGLLNLSHADDLAHPGTLRWRRPARRHWPRGVGINTFATQARTDSVGGGKVPGTFSLDPSIQFKLDGIKSTFSGSYLLWIDALGAQVRAYSIGGGEVLGSPC